MVAIHRRQLYYYNDGGLSYTARVAIGVVVAVGVAILFFIIAYIMRRRRGRAFKKEFPVEQSTLPVVMNGPVTNPTPHDDTAAPAYQYYGPDVSVPAAPAPAHTSSPYTQRVPPPEYVPTSPAASPAAQHPEPEYPPARPINANEDK